MPLQAGPLAYTEDKAAFVRIGILDLEEQPPAPCAPTPFGGEVGWPLEFLTTPRADWSLRRRCCNVPAALALAYIVACVFAWAYELTLGVPLAATLAHLVDTRGADLPASAWWGLTRAPSSCLDAWVRICAVLFLLVAPLWLCVLLPHAVVSNLVAVVKHVVQRPRRIRLV